MSPAEAAMVDIGARAYPCDMPAPWRPRYLLVVAAFLSAPASWAQEPTSALRVACLGDGATSGAGLVDPEHHAYPARLGYRLRAALDGRVEVRAFGVEGGTLTRRGVRPYAESDGFRAALAWRPDVAVLQLGSADITAPGRGEVDDVFLSAELRAGAEELVLRLRAVNPAVRVVFAGPTVAAGPGVLDGSGARDEPNLEAPERQRPAAPRVDVRPTEAEVRARRAQLVEETLTSVVADDRAEAPAPRLQLVLLRGTVPADQLVDGVLPNPFGADAVAARLEAALRLAPPRAAWLVPMPSAEHRSAAAGWGSDTWHGQVDRARALAAAQPSTAVTLLGDSITQGVTGSQQRLARAGGPRPIDRVFGEVGALSLGLSGDRTEHLLYRVEHGALAAFDPRVVVLQIGANDVNTANRAADAVAEGIIAVVDALARHEPGAHVVICGPFPLGRDPADPRRAVIDGVHARIASLDARERVTYLDLRPLFLDADGRANDRLAADGIHVTSTGYEAWMTALEPVVRPVLHGGPR